MIEFKHNVYETNIHLKYQRQLKKKSEVKSVSVSLKAKSERRANQGSQPRRAFALVCAAFKPINARYIQPLRMTSGYDAKYSSTSLNLNG